MLSVLASLSRVIAVVALVSVTAASNAPVIWAADAPDLPLRPVGTAADSVLVIQYEDRVLWISQDDQVATVMTLGWEIADGDTELAGATTLEAVYRTTGSLSIGEPPKSVSFTFES